MKDFVERGGDAGKLALTVRPDGQVTGHRGEYSSFRFELEGGGGGFISKVAGNLILTFKSGYFLLAPLALHDRIVDQGIVGRSLMKVYQYCRMPNVRFLSSLPTWS